ncbi:T-cell immunomodulatory protein [Pholidichthys leucotaenia]
MWAFKLNILAFLLLFVLQKHTHALQDVTADLFGAANYGTVAAFGDFNADKQTDIFIIREQSEVLIFLADPKSPYFKPKINITKGIPRDAKISSVVPGDYDGDSQMDVLLTAQLKPSAEAVYIFWGNNQTLDHHEPLRLNKSFTDQPLVMDFNGDMIPDIFGVTEFSTTEVCYLKDRVQKWETVLPSVSLYVPHSNAFIDLNKDFTADLFLTVEKDPMFETWLNKDGNFSKTNARPKPSQAKVIGQSSFADFDGDGYQDHLLPVCLDETCQHSAIYLAKSNSEEWVSVLLEFQHKDTIWGFVPGSSSTPLVLHVGDYNLDGFPDALVVLRNTSGSGQQAFLLENVPCSNQDCHSVGRSFYIHWDQSDLGAIQNAVMATFFDIYEDGILDMLVLSQAEGKEDLIIHALKNNFEADAYFVKVMVLSGLCSNDCGEDVKPFGVNQPGPYVMYTTVGSNGYLKNASAGQLSQSAHFALQLPYTVLGLGRSANFLDHLFVGIPRQRGVTEIRKQEWTAIIPNSQLIVMPFPHDSPRSWSAKLYLTPSNSVLLTAIALIGVCVFILVIIGILHWQEKKADDREKRQEAHRFHFDAM